MRKRFSIAEGLQVLIAAGVLLGGSAGWAATGYRTVFQDGFASGSTVRWTSEFPLPAAREGSDWFLRLASPVEAALVHRVVYSAYRFQADVRLNGGNAKLGFRLNHNTQKGYWVNITPAGLSLERTIDGATVQLTSDTFAISPTAWHTVETSGSLGRIDVYVDGSLRLTCGDSTPWFAGSIGLAAGGGPGLHVDFDNVAVLVPASDEPPWEQTNGPTAGTIRWVEIDPGQPDVLYACGTGGGGLFKTTNGGESWNLLPEFFSPSSRIRGFVMSSSNSQTLYAHVRFGPLFKSVNGGQDWIRLIPSQAGTVTRMAMNSADDSELIVSGVEGSEIFRTTDGGTSWTNVNGNIPKDEEVMTLAVAGRDDYWASVGFERSGTTLYHTTNGGVSWSPVNIGRPSDTVVVSFLVDPGDPNILYVGIRRATDGTSNISGQMLFKTDNGGSNWQTMSQYPGYASAFPLQKDDSGALYVADGYHLFRSSGDGQSWAEITPGLNKADIYDIAIDPRDGDVLYIPTNSAGILKSVDGGTSWTRLTAGILNTASPLLAVPNIPGSGNVYTSAYTGSEMSMTEDYGESWLPVGAGITHPFADELVITPYDPSEIWMVSDIASIYISHNGGLSFTEVANAHSGGGFRFGSVYAMAVAQSTPGLLYGVKSGYGIFVTDTDGDDWNLLRNSEIDYTYSLAVHPADHKVVYSGYNPKPFQNWAMVRQTTDGGHTWRTALKVDEAKGITSVAIDPNDPDTVYAGSTGKGGVIWASYDAGTTWSKVNEYFTFTNIHAFVADPADHAGAYAGVWGGGTFKTVESGSEWFRFPGDPTISASSIMPDPTNPDIIYLADRTSPRIYRSTSGGFSWEILFDAGDGYYRVMTAALAPNDPTVIYASIFRASRQPMDGHLFRIKSGTGTNVTGTLPRLPVALAVDPGNADTVYAVLHVYGVSKTINGGQTWTDISGSGSGLPQIPRVGFNGLIVDPANPSTLYLIGGCDVDLTLTHSGADPADMNTVYKSSDGGSTWINLNDGNLGSNSGSIKGLAISPLDGNVLYVGALNGVFRSLNGGTSWTDISTGLNYTHTAGVALSPNGLTLYVPTLGGGVFTGSVNPATHDVAWNSDSALIADIHHVQINVDPSSTQTLYASAYPGGIFKSLDRGVSWSECNFGMASFKIDDPNRQGYYAFAIAPSSPSTLYLGLYGVGIYKSTDGAGTWRPMNGQMQTMRGKYISSLLVDSLNSLIVYVGTENGVFRTTNGGNAWEDFSTGLDCLDVRTLAAGTDAELYAGTRGYEIYIYDLAEPSNGWTQTSPFNTFGVFWPLWNDRPLYQYTELLFDPTDHDIIYLGAFPSGIYKSLDGGQSWRERNVGWTNDGVFSLVCHPGNPEIIYAGTYNGVNRTLDAANHWEMWDAGWPPEQWVFSIDFDPRDPGIMYACSKNGENEGTGRKGFHGTVMKSLDGGENWFPITTGLDTDQEFYKIIVDKNTPDTLYLAAEHDGAFISRDGGALWLPWNEGLTNHHPATNDNNVTDMMVQTADGSYMFFGTEGSSVFRRQTGPIQHMPAESQHWRKYEW